MRLVGFDFETANPCSGSICAVGLAVVEDAEACAKIVARLGIPDGMVQRFASSSE